MVLENWHAECHHLIFLCAFRSMSADSQKKLLPFPSSPSPWQYFRSAKQNSVSFVKILVYGKRSAPAGKERWSRSEAESGLKKKKTPKKPTKKITPAMVMLTEKTQRVWFSELKYQMWDLSYLTLPSHCLAAVFLKKRSAQLTALGAFLPD